MFVHNQWTNDRDTYYTCSHRYNNWYLCRMNMNNNILNKILTILSLGVILSSLAFVTYSKEQKPSPEISIADSSTTGPAKVVAASCGFGTGVPHFVGDTYCAGGCPNGQYMLNGVCVTWCTVGSGWNTTTNSCVACTPGQISRGNACVSCPAGQMPNATLTACVSPTTCSNGASNPPTCTCTSSQVLFNGRCTECQNGGCTNNRCNNGATNAPLCNTCSNPQFYWNSQTRSCVSNPCGNVMPPADYGQSCGGGRNACGQTSTSGIVQCDGSCSVANANSSCIQSYNVGPTSVYPNGSVDFSWKVLPAVDGGSVKCGFYDRSQGNGVGLGVPIPGLQNLDTQADKFRINNIQRNTEFCLVCVYADKNGTPQTPAAQHQWVRVIRIGEN